MAVTTNAELSALVAGETIPSRFLATVRARPDSAALRWRSADGFGSWTWTEYAGRAASVAAGLRGLGVERGARVVLLMRNRPEFHVADVAALLAGATPISIYNSSSAEQVHYLVAHARARVAIVEDGEYLARLLALRDDLPVLADVVVIDPPDPLPAGVTTWSALLDAAPVDMETAATAVDPHDVATVIYTSGTTGPPKGVVLDHENLCWTIESLRLALGMRLDGRRVVSYLPMAHIAERMVSHYLGLALGFEVTTCPETALLAGYLADVRPELVVGVPRVWEKIHATVRALASADPAKAAELDRALEIGARAAAARALGGELSGADATRYASAEAELLRPVRQLLGLDAVICAISAAAPIPDEVDEFFRALGVPLSEMYGLSESSGPMTWEPHRVRLGTVGPPIPGLELRLGEDGEVLCRGGNVFRGYLDDPERTAETLDGDGWLHSGDVGTLDDAGFLRIVDRKKELIITAGGKNVSPANLEAALKGQPLIGQACVVGEGRPFVAVLLVLDPDVAPVWASQHAVEGGSLAALSTDPAVHAEVEREVAEANRRFSHAEQVKRFVLLGEEWLPDSDELTPTMKLKRRGILAKYAAEIEGMYA